MEADGADYQLQVRARMSPGVFLATFFCFSALTPTHASPPPPQMMMHLREVNVDNNTVGWYQSTYMGSYQTVELIEKMINFHVRRARSAPLPSSLPLLFCAVALFFTSSSLFSPFLFATGVGPRPTRPTPRLHWGTAPIAPVLRD